MTIEITRRDWLRGTTALSAAAAFSSLAPHQLLAATDPYARLDATAQASLVAKGQVSPLELVDAAIRRIDQLEPQLNALISMGFEQARTRAQSGDLPDGPFKGVPYLIKDLIDYPGLPMLSGSQMTTGNMSTYRSPYIDRTDGTGLIVLGKSTTPEFGFIPSTEPVFDAPTPNPWNTGHSAGGSSGGAAVAVASGMVPFAHASDGGGSIRIPASCCGLFGLKPSRGRQPKSRTYDRTPDLSVEHCLSRSIRDSARLLAATERQEEKALLAPTGFVEGPTTVRRTIGWSPRTLEQSYMHADVKAAIENTALLCRDLGHTLVEIELPFSESDFIRQFKTVWAAGAAGIVGRYKEQTGRIPDETVLEPFTLAFANYFYGLPTEALPAAFAFLTRVERQVHSLFGEIDLYLSPVLSTPPPALGHLAPTVSFEILWGRLETYAPHTPWQNVAGVPAMSVPLSKSREKLPIGSQFTAGLGREDMLLQLAYELEQATPWAHQWPSLSSASL
ncbi:MAG: hypothetical protein COA62_03465 [Rhodobiaceae bacterium]|nr:MAG: hypothetical protein COA62_03465 [Rhodobiaceae bacterium]